MNSAPAASRAAAAPWPAAGQPPAAEAGSRTRRCRLQRKSVPRLPAPAACRQAFHPIKRTLLAITSHVACISLFICNKYFCGGTTYSASVTLTSSFSRSGKLSASASTLFQAAVMTEVNRQHKHDASGRIMPHLSSCASFAKGSIAPSLARGPADLSAASPANTRSTPSHRCSTASAQPAAQGVSTTMRSSGYSHSYTW